MIQLTRRTGIVGAGATLLCPVRAMALNKTIDLRNHTEKLLHAVTFAAVSINWSSKAGHAYIIWQKENAKKRMSTAQAIGFYPKEPNNIFEVIFGGPGELRDDTLSQANFKTTVYINSNVYKSALEVRNNWRSEGTYKLTSSNCVIHVNDIAQAIGLKTKKAKWTFPEKYIQMLNELNLK